MRLIVCDSPQSEWVTKVPRAAGERILDGV